MPGERDCVEELTRVAREPRLTMQETVALGLLVTRKWDRAFLHVGAATATAAEAAAFDHFTVAEITGFRSEVDRLLDQHIASRRLKPGWWSGFWQGYAASIAYALTLATVAILI